MERDEHHADAHHGVGGSYEVVNGVRRLIEGSRTQPHEDGDGPRDASGKPLGNAAASTEPALPAPQRAPWEAKAPASAESEGE